MKTKYLTLTIAIFLIIAQWGCKKEACETATPQNAEDQILKFKSKEDFDQSISTVLKMTHEERMEWTKEKGFKSFGVKCDEVYSISHPENFTTFEQFNTLVENNSAFLLLEKTDNGEYILETVLSKSPFRYFANLERLFQVDDIIYKVLEKGTVSTSIKNIDKLKFINEQNYASENGKDPDLIFSNCLNGPKTSSLSKSVTAMFICGKYKTDYQSSGNDRTYMYIWAYTENYTNTQGALCSRNILHYQVVPKHRTGFVWFVVQRTINLSISAEVGHTIYSTPPYQFKYSYDTFNATKSNWFTNNAEDWLQGTGCIGGWYDDDYGFKWHHCWGDTPSSPTVNLDCGN